MFLPAGEKQQLHRDLLILFPKTSIRAATLLSRIKITRVRSSEVGFMVSTGINTIASNPASWQQSSKTDLQFINKTRQKGEKKKSLPKSNPNMKWKNWCYHSLNTAEERGYCSQTIHNHSSSPLSAHLFLFFRLSYREVNPVNSNTFNSLAFLFVLFL